MAVTILKPVPVMAGEHRQMEPQIEFQLAAFDPWRIQPVRHRLSDHPLLQPDSLLALSARLEAAGRIRTHANDATAGTPFNDAPSLHPNPLSATDTLNSLREAKAWMSLLNVQTDAVYRELVGSVLDSVQALIEQRDPGMCHRAGWIFVSSPKTVTPFHFDKEHNFILQIHGRKRVYVWDHLDTTVASELARDRFHQRHERDQLQWRDGFRGRARVFDLHPGEGAYMPSTSPHMVESGDEPSITISFTYYTDATRRDAMLHKTHAVLRDIGIVPPAVGKWPTLDALTFAAVTHALRLRSMAKRLIGRSRALGYARFAQAGM